MPQLIRLLSTLLGLLAVTPALADPMPALGLADRPGWTAVGVVNGAGYRARASCTGTLIAPDLVLTAAHCARGKPHFVAGWDRGSFAAHRKSRAVTVHPRYHAARGTRKFHFDIALLHLETPINPRVVAPLALAAPGGDAAGPFTLLGYHRKRPHVLNGRADCVRLNPSDKPVLTIGCEVISGNSGGPVLARAGDGWALVGVLVARIGGQPPRALAVSVDDWLAAHWRAGVDRAAKRWP